MPCRLAPAPFLAPVLAPLLALSLTAAPALAEWRGVIQSAELLPGWRTETGGHMTALRVRLAPGWKTYWRAPGGAGIPPSFDWSGSDNLRSVRIHWPRPLQFSLNGLRTLGYAPEMVLPIEVQPATAGAPIHLSAEVSLGVCRDICVPAQVTVSADLPAEGGEAADPAIRAALAARPRAAAAGGVRSHRCTVEPATDGLRLTAEIDVPTLGAGEIAVIETADPDLWVSEAQTTRAGGRLTAVADIVPLTDAPVALDRRGLTITLIAGDRAIEIEGCPAR